MTTQIGKMNRVTVFCGSSFGTDKIYQEQAYLAGKTLARQGVGLVYGGAKVGLMGAVADGAMENGGEVIGVLPRFLQGKEIAHENLSQLIIVDTMHERKMKMNELSGGVIALPGGFGTLEEFFEMLTWGQLGLHQKPMAILNINGFYNLLIQLVQNMVDNGFLKEINQQMLLSDDNIDTLLEKMKNYQPPPVAKWITKETT
jgi:uncharacterized protein (TIGR00730 family)